MKIMVGGAWFRGDVVPPYEAEQQYWHVGLK